MTEQEIYNKDEWESICQQDGNEVVWYKDKEIKKILSTLALGIGGMITIFLICYFML